MQSRRKKKRSLLHDPPPALRALFILAGILLIGIGIGALWIAFTPVPDLNTISNTRVSQSTKILDRTGDTVLYDLNPNVTRNIIPLSDVAPFIQEASISIEDADFYYNNGISIPAIIRSLFTDIATGSFAQGGSTITQQVVKNTLLTNDKTIVRKVHEWILAIKLEQRYNKDQILELYFNNTPYGGTLYGVSAASRAFFGKDPKDVDLAEAAYLAALPQSPTYFSPYGQHRSELDARKNLVLDRMQKLGYITADQASAAKAEQVTFSPQQNNSIIAPHFVFYIEQYLEDKYGPAAVENGLTVQTTLDVDLERDAEATVNKYALQNQKTFNASNAALVAIDPTSGQILAMVGSRGYFDTSIDGNYNAALALRQPGSAFKPFVYSGALLKGYTPDTVIYDLPTQFSTTCSPNDNFNDNPPCYAPSDYDGKFRGQMTFTTALAQSINVPAVKVLYLAGIQNVIDLARGMGITTLGKASDYGLSFALGAADVRLLDITSAYGAFANDGTLNPPTGILKITDASGTVLEQYATSSESVIDSGVARQISSMLSNNQARQPEYPPDNPFVFSGYDVAAKTGTTNDYRDAWTIGYSPNLVVGAWAGNNDNSPMVKEIAGYIVAPMWHAFMAQALKTVPVAYFAEPPATPDNAPGVLHGIPGGTELLDAVNKNNPLVPGTSSDDAQARYWDYPLLAGPSALIPPATLFNPNGTTTGTVITQ